MKIGIFTEVYEPYICGISTSVKMLKEALTNMRQTVYIVTANIVTNKFIYDEKNKIIYLPGIKTGIYNTKLTNFYSKKALKIIKSWNLDIIHSQTEFGVGLFSRIVARKLDIPVVHTYHTLYEDYIYYVTHGHFKKIGTKIMRKITDYYCDKKCDELIVPTVKIKDLFLNKYHYSRPIHVIPTGIDLNKFKENAQMKKEIKKLRQKYHLQESDFIIGTVGRIAQEKNLGKEIQTIAKLIQTNSDIKLILVGDGPLLKELKELVKNLDITKNVIFTGKVPYEKMPIYYHLFNVMSSFSITETQGLTIIEALGAMKPIVCINDESFKTMIEDGYNGYIFNNEEEFRTKMLKLKNSTTDYERIKQNALNSVYKYSKEVFASEVLKVYYKALQKQR